MSNYGIKCGVYVFRNTDNIADTGKWVEVKKVSPKFVTCEFYNYCDNKINKDHRCQYYCSGKRKKVESNGTLLLGSYYRNYDFKDAEYYDINGYFTSFELDLIEYENCDEPSDENIENIISENFDEILFYT